MNLREQYYILEEKVRREYNKLINESDYDIMTEELKAAYGDRILDILEGESVWRIVEDYLCGIVKEISYNNNQGERRLGYLLGVEKENGVRILDCNTSRPRFISFSDLSDIMQKIIVVEEIKNFKIIVFE